MLMGATIASGVGVRLPGHNNPPAARPQRRSGGEGFPPLPLPVTPLRRSEKKREPSPPTLIAKIAYAKHLYNITNDVRRLLYWAKRDINISYRPVTLPLDKFSYDPTEVPVIYFSGHEPIGNFTKTQARKLREYVYGGGTILANACCGAPEFTKSFRKVIVSVFPQRRLHRLSPEHPIFHCYNQLETVAYQKGTSKHFSADVLLEGIDIGCRTAVIFAPADLSNGWYGLNPPGNYPPGFWMMKNDARKLGVNIIDYILSNLLYARAYPLTQVQYKTPATGGQALDIAQIIHQGDWDPNPSALQRLQKYLSENSTIKVDFKRTALDLSSSAIFEHPVLYMVGHREFTFSDAQISNLRRYLSQGGVMLAEACCGRREFDLAFRREIKRVFPEYRLKPIDPSNPIYSVNYKIRHVSLTPLAKQFFPDLKTPWLESIEINGRAAVIYSPLGMSSGWEGLSPPFSAGYDIADSLRLGVNIIVYIMTH